MNKSSANSQDIFLNQVRKENIPVTVYLINSVQLQGHVRGFDTFTILLESPGRPTQLVYKSSITSIVPIRPVRLYEPPAEGQSSERQDSGSDTESSEDREPRPRTEQSWAANPLRRD